MDSVISLRNVTKRFGTNVAVNDVTIDVPKGRCYAWLGPNGCGKTTLIRMMLGLARPTSGQIAVRGLPIPERTRDALSRVGGIVEEPRFYPYLTGRQNLEVWAAHQSADAKAAISGSLERVHLADRGDDKVSGYSLGMRQRLGVARALLNDPELLVLDEPTNGLDPAGLAEFRQMIRAFVDEGRSVFISSHILSEVEKMADDVAIIEKGKVLAHGSVAELLRGGRQAVGVRVDDPERALPLLRALPFAQDVRAIAPGAFEVSVAELDDDALRRTGRELFSADIGVLELRAVRETLERRFLELTGNQAGELGGHAGGPPTADVPTPDDLPTTEAR
ncbi:ABC transporter related protein [Patulibacter medicamentivorans]|uniref:ABC transporter related protein n=1 Tax=Patulibacter medicamentivorans TaxID=1097667 RepID=H0E5T8_9ACTN|nr:ABC transporter ATP-binding protein [Patulibacter medicamentivorans]EHN10958.1 ABC transporter related protein [Patulibacter medicamentivorans]